MPTGYTAQLVDGEQSFDEFVMECARAFGALILLRDHPPQTPIPEFEPHIKYDQEAIETARSTLDELDHMSLEEAQERARDEFEMARQRRRETNEKAAEVRERLEAMLARVQQWQPPTPDHVGLKEFMVQQLTETIEFDGSPASWPDYPLISGAEWMAARRAKAERDIEYSTKKIAEEIERTDGRNAWVKALRGSLA